MTTGSTAEPDEAPAKPRGGRPRDPGRDTAILAAALDVLAEHGYDAMTMDEVAKRAGAGKATVYRRWSSKADLVAQAVAQVGSDEPSAEDLPDTGTLRGDLLALMRPQGEEESARVLAITGGLASMLAREPALADVASAALIGPFVGSQRILIQRAVRRGEVAADVDVETVAYVTPSMTAFRLIVQRRPIDIDYLHLLVDTVVLPALGLPRPAHP